MNCLEFRRRLSTDPNDRSEDFLRHKRECPDCAPEVEKINHLDEQLLRALQVDVPEGLASQILLNHAFQKRRVPVRLAWVASVLLGIGVAGWLGYLTWHETSQDLPALQAVVLDHANNGLATVSLESYVEYNQLSRLLGHLGAYLQQDLGPVYYAKKCQVNDRDALHLIIPGQKGPLTVFLLPNENLSDTVAVESPDFAGIIMPAEHGSIVVMGEAGESFQQTAEKVKRSLAWL